MSMVSSVRCDGGVVLTRSDVDVDCVISSGLGSFSGDGAIGWTTAVTTLPDDAELTVIQPSSLAALHRPGLDATQVRQFYNDNTNKFQRVLMKSLIAEGEFSTWEI